jgi:hypothetical protein
MHIVCEYVGACARCVCVCVCVCVREYVCVCARVVRVCLFLSPSPSLPPSHSHARTHARTLTHHTHTHTRTHTPIRARTHAHKHTTHAHTARFFASSLTYVSSSTLNPKHRPYAPDPTPDAPRHTQTYRTFLRFLADVCVFKLRHQFVNLCAKAREVRV